MAENPRRIQAKEGLDSILRPRSLAVVGASSQAGSVGHALLKSILDGGFPGPVYAVNPKASEVLGVRSWPDVERLPEAPELAVVAVPAAAVLQVAESCGRKGVKGLLVISAGFREADEAGKRREEELRAIVRRHGMRMVGPNCLGVINADPQVRLHATFAPRHLLPGKTALVTQSGAVGIALLEHAAQIGLGVSRFVSMGNKTDVSGNDLLLLWEDDPQVSQVLMYLEDFGNPRNFVEIARRFTRRKPITVLKAGRTARGAKAAGSHTGALMAADHLVDALLGQCGVLRADSVSDLFDTATALATQATLQGNRVAIVTNSGGPAILAVDVLEKAGMELAELSASTVQGLQALLPAASHAANPVDLLASGSAEAYESAVRLCLADPWVDAILVIWTPLHADDTAQAESLAMLLAGSPKPAASVVFGHGPSTRPFQTLALAGIPTYTFPEQAVASLGALWKVALWRRKPEPPVASPAPVPPARRIVAELHPDPAGWIPMREAFALAQAYGIPLPDHRWVDGPTEAVAAAHAIGYPVVLKADVPGLVHKTEAGAVRLGIGDEAQLRRAFAAMAGSMASRGLDPSGFLVMATALPGPEILVGIVQDPLFGPVVACGAGGVYTEILKDVKFRLAPVSDDDVQDMLRGLRIAPLLAGARGEARKDVAAVSRVVGSMARLAVDCPAVLEAELNPVRTFERGAAVLDVRIRVTTSPRGGIGGPSMDPPPPGRPMLA